jgi:hypothetical protein
MIINIVRQTIMITSLVLVMMLLIEYFNVVSNGRLGKNLFKSKIKQVVVSALLGLIPGCIGGFAVVSMFTHNLVNFGALVASMIASTGDESFLMFSMFPMKALILNIILFVISIGAGFIVNMFVKSYRIPYPDKTHMVIHNHEFKMESYSWKTVMRNLQNISFARAILIFGLLLFLFGIITGQFEHGTHQAIASGHEHSEWGFENIVFVGISLVALYLLLLVDEHFLYEHLWEHIIKKHFLRILLWTFAALLGIEILANWVDVTPFIHDNRIIVLIIAVLMGIIPESGPHIIWVTLFFKGDIPFSILLANSIVQDGHSTIPLLAESKRGFFMLKGINVLIGLAFGLAGYFLGW